MVKIELFIDKSIEKNASLYFDKVKKYKKKILGAKVALDNAQKKKEELLKKEQPILDDIETKEKRKKEWYEKFRWFYTSDGFLVLGGRDATTNEIVVKKHTLPEDLIFHTDMAGSPFFILKTDGKEPSKEAIEETAQATATFSKAWKLNLGSSSVFYVKPEQVSKEAQSGEYMPKGAFMIRGKTTYVPNEVSLAIGLYNDTYMAAPLNSIKANCKEYIDLEQGDEKVSVIAKIIQRRFKGELDDIIRVLPAGSFNIKKD
jgi:predicted ribosome quality control (RQC) complex YloA/Tae2 family protein